MLQEDILVFKKFVKQKLNKKKLKIVWIKNMAYNIAPNLFWELGHKVISINNNPDGVNINKDCSKYKSIIKKVIQQKADVGFAFDGDGDRIIVIDENGIEVDGDKIIAVFSKYFVKPKNKNQFDVIITVMSNIGLEKYLTNKLKLRIKRTNVGDINVINEMKKIKSSLGGEQSGHIIMSNFSNTGDGILAALKITEILTTTQSKASSLFDLYKNYPQEKINLTYSVKNKKLLNAIEKLKKDKSINNNNLRSLVRFSGTEPLIRILVEGKNINIVKSNLLKIKNSIRFYLD